MLSEVKMYYGQVGIVEWYSYQSVIVEAIRAVVLYSQCTERQLTL